LFIGAEIMKEYIESYDPECDPNPEAWLALGEGERLSFISGYHKKARIKLPSQMAHAAFHVIVENQVAMGDKIPVCRTLKRLLAEGLDRHDAIHAIGSVLAKFMYNRVKKNDSTTGDPNLAYWAALEQLTIESWQNSEELPD